MTGGFLVVGHHRSGTSFLNSLIRSHPDVESMNEPLSQHVKAFLDWDLQPWNPQVVGRVPAAVADRPWLHGYLQDLRSLLHEKGGPVVGFKETCLTHKLDWAREFFEPKAVVAIVRDPRATVASVVKRNMHERWAYLDRLRELDAAAGTDDLDWTDPVQVTARSWAVRASDIRASGVPCWRLEDLMLEPDTARQIMAAIGLDLHPRQREFMRHAWDTSRSATYSYRRTPDHVRKEWMSVLSDDQRADVERVAGSTMQAFGYQD